MNIFLGESGTSYIYSVNAADGTFYDFVDSFGETPHYLMMSTYTYPNAFTFGDYMSGVALIYVSGESTPCAYIEPVLEQADITDEDHTETIRYPIGHVALGDSGIALSTQHILNGVSKLL